MADEQAQTPKPSPEAKSPSDKPKIGDSRPAPKVGDSRPAPSSGDSRNQSNQKPSGEGQSRKRRRRRGGRGRGGGQRGTSTNQQQSGQQRQGGDRQTPTPVEAIMSGEAVELDERTLKRRRGRTRKGKAVGRYLMCVHVGPKATQIATLEGRKLVEHQVSRPADDISQIHGNIYLGRVQNVLPGMEAAFVDIATPKNAVLYAGDVQYDADDIEGGKKKGQQPRIEDVLKELKEEITIIMVTNLVQQARRLADRTAFFLGGQCVEIGDTEDFFTGEVADQRTREYVEGRFG